jgi:hypothetical protein
VLVARCDFGPFDCFQIGIAQRTGASPSQIIDAHSPCGVEQEAVG